MPEFTDSQLLARWRDRPEAGAMVTICTDLAKRLEKDPKCVSLQVAEEIGVEAESRYPRDFEVLLALGRLFLAAGHLHRALKPLIASARIASEPRALRFLGEVFLRLGDARHAAMAFERAIKRGAADVETKAWYESAKGYVSIQEARGTEYVAAEVEKSQAAARAAKLNGGGNGKVLASMMEGELLEEEGDNAKTEVMKMSRVVAVMQQSPELMKAGFGAVLAESAVDDEAPTVAPAAGRPSTMKREALQSEDSLEAAAPTIVQRKPGALAALGLGRLSEDAVSITRDSDPVDFDLDAASSDELVDESSSITDEPTQQKDRDEPTGKAAAANQKVSGALAAATSRLANAANAGPVSATSDRILPVKLDSKDSHEAPAPAVVPRSEPRRVTAASAVQSPPRRKKKKGFGFGSVGLLALFMILACSTFAVRTGRLPWLAERVPSWVSGQPDADALTRTSNEAAKSDATDDAPTAEPTVEPTATAEVAASAEPVASVAPSTEPSAEPTTEPTAEPTATAAAPPPPPPPPPKAPPPPPKAPPKAPPPKAPPPKAPPPKAPPPKAPPPKAPPAGAPDPDVVWLGDPELKVGE